MSTGERRTELGTVESGTNGDPQPDRLRLKAMLMQIGLKEDGDIAIIAQMDAANLLLLCHQVINKLTENIGWNVTAAEADKKVAVAPANALKALQAMQPRRRG